MVSLRRSIPVVLLALWPLLPLRAEVGERAAAGAPRFTGIELGPGLLDSIRHKIRMESWSQDEIDAYYEVLDHARTVPYDRQKQVARQNLLASIERYRVDAEAEYRAELERIEQLRRRNPENAATHDRLERRAERKRDARLRACRRYRDDPREFPTFVELFKDLDSEDRGRYHGKLVTLDGHVRKLISYPAAKNDFGIETLYEAWIFTPKSQSIPAVVVCTSIPEGMPRGEGRNYSVEASVTGYAFKMHVYSDSEGEYRKVPMILAQTIEWRPPPPERATAPWVYAAVGGAFLVLLGALVWVGRQDRRLRRGRLQSQLADRIPETED